MENTSSKESDSDFKIPPKPVDMTIFCKTCQKKFLWSAKEQKYYEKKGFRKKPQKCNSCRERANKLRDNSMFYIHCGLCNSDGVMLAPPPKDRVAICDECFNKLILELKKQKANAKIGP